MPLEPWGMWMNYNGTTAAARAAQKTAPLQDVWITLKWIPQMRETQGPVDVG